MIHAQDPSHHADPSLRLLLMYYSHHRQAMCAETLSSGTFAIYFMRNIRRCQGADSQNTIGICEF